MPWRLKLEAAALDAVAQVTAKELLGGEVALNAAPAVGRVGRGTRMANARLGRSRLKLPSLAMAIQ